MKLYLPDTHPKLAVQWHPTLNGELSAAMFTFGSGKTVWWKGDCNHEWESKICTRSGQNQGCPYCAGKKVLQGFNDLGTTHPDLASQWHPTLNQKFLLEEITAGSDHRVWWIGLCGHEWDAVVRFRTKNDGKCPICLGRRVITGINDFPTTHPELLSFWDTEKNSMLDPYTLFSGSRTKASWKCELGHEWKGSVVNQTVKTQGYCSTCNGKKLLAGYNDLKFLHPVLASEWHPTMNLNDSSQVSPESHDKAWWIGSCGHSWESAIRNRVKQNTACPYCNNSLVLDGFNDLATTHPKLSIEWHDLKNGSFKSNEITAGSNQKVWWKCIKGHEWAVRPADRTGYNTGCPECAAANRVSKGEQEIADFLITHGLVISQSDRKQIGGKELDIYIPEKKFAIEYNGVFWHSEDAGKDKFYHYDKWLAAKNAGIYLLQVWEDDWLRNPALVKNMILHKLNLSDTADKVFARKTSVINLDTRQAKEFLNEYHIQGYTSGSCYYGLVNEQGIIVSVLTLKRRSADQYEIVRYATSLTVVGGFTKLMKHAERMLSPHSFVTFSDHCVSDGSLYQNNGFIIDKELDPDYSYLVNGERKHKFGYRLKKFRDDPSLLWDENLTEKELARLNKIPRIWDAGKTRWIKNIV